MLQESADEATTRQPLNEWIVALTRDPIYHSRPITTLTVFYRLLLSSLSCKVKKRYEYQYHQYGNLCYR